MRHIIHVSLTLLPVILFCCGFPGCVTINAPLCLAEQALSQRMADKINEWGQCEDTAGVMTDVTSVVNSIHSCTPTTTPTGPIAVALCPPVINFMVDGLVANMAFITKHRCHPAAAIATLKSGLTAACVTFIPASTPPHP